MKFVFHGRAARKLNFFLCIVLIFSLSVPRTVRAAVPWPNEIAIEAALHPDTSQGYFFFCADMCNGGTVFARTEAEHEYNIQHYYLACDY